MPLGPRVCCGIFALVAFLLVGIAQPGEACSTFCVQEGERILFGKNYDWHFGDGLLVVNPRNVDRRADTLPLRPAARWRVRFGSVTFNQYGRELPTGGINEAGLVVELMWLDATRYPEPDGRPIVSGVQWIQYQLDTASTVAEVVASDRRVRIDRASPLHFLVADRSGAVATVEFLDGRMVVHQQETLPVPVLTNSTYERSVAYLERLETEASPTPRNSESLVRFARLGRYLDREGEGPWTIERAFEALAGVAQGSYTQWSIVYEIDALRIHFQTRESPRIKTLDLADVDFSCRSRARVLDLHHDAEGDVADDLVPYSSQQNRELVGIAYGSTAFLADVPSHELDRIARLSDRLVCHGDR